MGVRKNLRYVLGALVVGTLGLLFWLLSPTSVSEMRPSPGVSKASAPVARPHVASATPALEPPNAAASPAPARPPVIDAVLVEKNEVCEGEENLVTVKAHTVDGNDAFLHFTVAGQAGQRVPIRSYRESGHTPPRRVQVFSRDNAMAAADIPSFRVKDCRTDHALQISARPVPNSIAERELWVTLLAPPGAPPFGPVRYRWSFGDETEQETTLPRTVHDYVNMPQRSQYAQILVSVTAYATDGSTVTGRSSIQVLNHAFESRRAGQILVLAQPTPRFPVMDREGIVRQKFRILHYEDQPVEILRLNVTKQLVAADGAPIPDERKPIDIDHARLFPQTDIPPRQGIIQEFAFDFGSEPNVFAVDYVIEGVGADGTPAVGHLSVMRPMPTPTPENSTAVTDPALIAKIKKAMELLGQQTVSQEDLRHLEHEGKL